MKPLAVDHSADLRPVLAFERDTQCGKAAKLIGNGGLMNRSEESAPVWSLLSGCPCARDRGGRIGAEGTLAGGPVTPVAGFARSGSRERLSELSRRRDAGRLHRV
ncbi:hypothetical protein SKAU_G00229280 [Synaphobranchus kaupii]|uniref:Uncharacterized protein n=1 Tax=Synaphobranchus kaupii TaxID=118154 RepID=A0A9Q1F592_SYNKA|nr:hypothetical protein SKAU_G00229280 [Synaphobranchus kaupii]